MSRFPETRHTLIHRIAENRRSTDWQVFLDDYWGPVLRFARRSGGLNTWEAEDVASDLFEVLVADELLTRWLQDRRAKLRTLLCTVVRNLIANRARVQSGREKILATLVPELLKQMEQRQAAQDEDRLAGAWVDQLLQKTLYDLQQDYAERNRLDAFRVFHGRVAEGMTNAEIAGCLGLTVASVETHYKRVRNEFTQRLRRAVESHVSKYGDQADREQEVEAEWRWLTRHLMARGDLETAFRQIPSDELDLLQRESTSKSTVLHRLTKRLDPEQS